MKKKEIKLINEIIELKKNDDETQIACFVMNADKMFQNNNISSDVLNIIIKISNM